MKKILLAIPMFVIAMVVLTQNAKAQNASDRGNGGISAANATSVNAAGTQQNLDNGTDNMLPGVINTTPIVSSSSPPTPFQPIVPQGPADLFLSKQPDVIEPKSPPTPSGKAPSGGNVVITNPVSYTSPIFL